jgi:hypothetical protein
MSLEDSEESSVRQSPGTGGSKEQLPVKRKPKAAVQ